MNNENDNLKLLAIRVPSKLHAKCKSIASLEQITLQQWIIRLLEASVSCKDLNSI